MSSQGAVLAQQMAALKQPDGSHQALQQRAWMLQRLQDFQANREAFFTQVGLCCQDVPAAQAPAAHFVQSCKAA